jgi:hypothetical protein
LTDPTARVVDVHNTSGYRLGEREDEFIVVKIVLDVALRLDDCQWSSGCNASMLFVTYHFSLRVAPLLLDGLTVAFHDDRRRVCAWCSIDGRKVDWKVYEGESGGRRKVGLSSVAVPRLYRQDLRTYLFVCEH